MIGLQIELAQYLLKLGRSQPPQFMRQIRNTFIFLSFLVPSLLLQAQDNFNLIFPSTDTELAYEGALKSVEAMRVIDPQEYRLLLEAGVLYMRTDQHCKARPALEQYIEVAPTPRDRQEALAIMQHLRLDEE